MLSDIEIAQSATLQPITDIAAKVGLTPDDIEQYGKYKAKVPVEAVEAKGSGEGKLVLVTGISPTPAGEGKSTTLAACIDFLNDNVDHHIITIEDPIEFYHYHKKSTVNQREVGMDVRNFEIGMKHAVREDPDIILVGEMRDQETFMTAIHAAETGHLVFGTIHASTASTSPRPSSPWGRTYSTRSRSGAAVLEPGRWANPPHHRGSSNPLYRSNPLPTATARWPAWLA